MSDIKEHICTKENPKPKDVNGSYGHPDAEFLYDRDTREGSYERYKCPHCGLTFTIEVGD